MYKPYPVSEVVKFHTIHLCINHLDINRYIPKIKYFLSITLSTLMIVFIGLYFFYTGLEA